MTKLNELQGSPTLAKDIITFEEASIRSHISERAQKSLDEPLIALRSFVKTIEDDKSIKIEYKRQIQKILNQFCMVQLTIGKKSTSFRERVF